jgi:hypothetical protein
MLVRQFCQARGQRSALAGAASGLPDSAVPQSARPIRSPDERFLRAYSDMAVARAALKASLSGATITAPVFKRSAGWRQERVCGAQRLQVKFEAIAASPGSRDRTPGI